MKYILILCVVGVLGVAVGSADVLQTRSATFNGTVTRVEDGTIFIKVENAEMGVSRGDVVKLDVAIPTEYEAGVAALKAGKMAEAVTAFKAVVDRLGGLPVGWAIDCMFKLGDAYLTQNDSAAAEMVFARIKKLYPGRAEALEVKKARLLMANKKYDEAMQIVQGYLDLQMKKDYLTVDQETVMADALLILGDCLQANGKLYPALDSYLKVVTLYDYDEAMEAEARIKAAQILEQQGNWKRARESYDELIKAIPDSRYVAEAQRRSKAIVEAHPE